MSNDFYGATPQRVLETKLDVHLEELSVLGYTVVEDVIGAPELEALRTKLARAYEAQQREVAGSFRLEDIQEENQVRAPLCYDDHFVEMARHPRVIEAVRAILGNYFLIQLQIGIINVPNTQNRQSVWHRDLLYHDFVISRPLGVSAMLCMDDFNERTGGTIVVPFTHRLERMPSAQLIEKTAVPIQAKAGSFFLMDSMLLHKAGDNASDGVRRGLNTIYVSGLFKQQICLPRQLGGRHKDDPFLDMLLGYDGDSADSVESWRKRRHDKLTKKT